MFLRLVHLTRYDYSQPVSFAPHALYLRPRETSRQRLHEFKLEVSPSPRCIATSDAEDNALGGVVGAGEVFPTDDLCAPAHPGCRCMITPAHP